VLIRPKRIYFLELFFVIICPQTRVF
jgi:hypothetical protein